MNLSYLKKFIRRDESEMAMLLRQNKYQLEEVVRLQKIIAAMLAAAPQPTTQQLGQGAFIPQVSGFGAAPKSPQAERVPMTASEIEKRRGPIHYTSETERRMILATYIAGIRGAEAHHGIGVNHG